MREYLPGDHAAMPLRLPFAYSFGTTDSDFHQHPFRCDCLLSQISSASQEQLKKTRFRACAPPVRFGIL